ncbi:hypothetical protein K435DRAFT_384053 [Dendrothele bispora CBS 962.96]|uniref:X-box-binding protein 1 n=1 Tax=Dendrothele bispora (strain CBS 962.96) TaxID=1314807 RepID=A0A4S8LBK6_DENBC|nr:hypothetical protein K435DRAFT_384053 [Dendrothele bispora CBS 962.96]
MSAQSPASSSTSAVGSSRKRPRSEVSSEERKEARAHRNRIAAQNSRDRRKAQFTYLEHRVQELEEENRQLRAGMGLSSAAKTPADEARDRENQELKDRIRTLEKGWDAVVKALAAQGLPTGLSSESASAPSPPSPSASHASPSSSSSAPTPSSPTSAPSNPPASQSASDFPISPAPSHASLDFTTTLSSASPVLSEQSLSDEHDDQSTRHLARVANIPGSPPRMSLQRVNCVSTLPIVHHPLLTSLHRSSLSTTLPWKLSLAKSSLQMSALPARRLQSLSRRPRSLQRVYHLLVSSRRHNHRPPHPLPRRK